MFLLEEFIYKTKMKFNNEVISLRDRKKAIIERSEKYNARINDINKLLNKSEDLFQPTLDETTEYPERYYEITDSELERFSDQKQKDSQKKPGFGGMGGAPAPLATLDKDESKPAQDKKVAKEEKF
jgi:hypothetical protein